MGSLGVAFVEFVDAGLKLFLGKIIKGKPVKLSVDMLNADLVLEEQFCELLTTDQSYRCFRRVLRFLTRLNAEAARRDNNPNLVRTE